MSNCVCKNCGCSHHCGTSCHECRNDVCQTCNCECCNPSIITSAAATSILEDDWAWQDSGIEIGF